MATTVLPQLQEVEAELSTQEETLTAQLAEVRKKLESLRSVLPMFDEDASSEPSLSATTKAAKAEAVTGSSKEKPAAKKATSTAKKTKPAAKAKTKKTKTTSKKKDGRAADWQKYTRPGVKNQSIPDAVKLVLTTQPDKGFKIAEVMDSLFKEGMPKAQYLKARNRVSNVLSGGVRAGDWHRGDRSTYRMSAA